MFQSARFSVEAPHTETFIRLLLNRSTLEKRPPLPPLRRDRRWFVVRTATIFDEIEM